MKKWLVGTQIIYMTHIYNAQCKHSYRKNNTSWLRLSESNKSFFAVLVQLPLKGKSHHFVTSRIIRMEWDLGYNILIWTTKLFANTVQMTLFK